jgi:hypothetical protein
MMRRVNDLNKMVINVDKRHPEAVLVKMPKKSKAPRKAKHRAENLRYSL